MKKKLTYAVIGVTLATIYLQHHPDVFSHLGGTSTAPAPPTESPLQPTNPSKVPTPSEPVTPQPSPPPDASGPISSDKAASAEPGNPDIGSDTSDIRDGAPIDSSRPTLLHFGLPMVAEREGTVHHCQVGVLTLNASTAEFTCQSEAKKSVTLNVHEAKVDKNGVQVPKDKYHFRIQGLKQEEVEQLFENWVNQGRLTP
jgi:hypothetical protein